MDSKQVEEVYGTLGMQIANLAVNNALLEAELKQAQARIAELEGGK